MGLRQHPNSWVRHDGSSDQNRPFPQHRAATCEIGEELGEYLLSVTMFGLEAEASNAVVAAWAESPGFANDIQ